MWEPAQLSSALITLKKSFSSIISSTLHQICEEGEFKTHLWLLFLGFWGFLSKFWTARDRVVPLTVPHCFSVPKAWNFTDIYITAWHPTTVCFGKTNFCSTQTRTDEENLIYLNSFEVLNEKDRLYSFLFVFFCRCQGKVIHSQVWLKPNLSDTS